MRTARALILLLGIVFVSLAAKPNLPPIIVDIPDDATAQNDDFGTGGLLTDIVAESSAGLGVFVDGMRIKDERINYDHAGTVTGDAGVNIKDNLSSAYEICESGTCYQRFTTTNNNEKVLFNTKVTTTHGVASGAERVIGGVHTINTTASTAITGATETLTAFDQGCTLEATALNRVGAVLKVRWQGLNSNMGAADTHTFAMRFNSTTVGITGNVAPVDEGPWFAEATCTTVSTGATGTLLCGGLITTSARAGTTPVTRNFYTGATTTSTLTFDLTGAIAVAGAWTWQAGANDADSTRQDFILCEITG